MRPKTRAFIAVALAIAVVVTILGYLGFWVLPYMVVQHHAIGANVSVSGKVPRTIAAAATTTPGASFGHTQALTPVVRITPGGNLSAAITLTFKLTRRLQPGDVALLATSESDHDSWILVQPTISQDGWYATVQTNHLSRWQVLWFDVTQAASDFKAEFLDSLSGDATTQAQQPHCDNEAAARQDDYVITRSAKDTLYWCFGVEDGQRVLKIVNRMRYPLEVSHAGLTVKHTALPKLELDELARLAAGPDTMLYPFEEADYTVDLAVNHRAVLDTVYSGLAQSLYQLEVGVTTAANVLTLFGAGGKVLKTAAMEGSTFAQIVTTTDKFLQIKDCAGALLDLHSGSVVSGCFSPADMIKAFGWKGFLLAPIMALGSLVEFFHSEFDAFVDIIAGNDQYGIIVSRFHPLQAGTIAAFTLPDVNGAPDNITNGPDGNLWFTVDGASGKRIGRITLDGNVTLFPLPAIDPDLAFSDLTAGPDGALWFTLRPYFDSAGPPPASQIGRMTTSGVVKFFPLPATDAPGSIITGPDGNLWFTESSAIGRMTPDGHITTFSVDASYQAGISGGIALGADGNIWFAALDGPKQYVGRSTPAGQITFYPIPQDEYSDACPEQFHCGFVAGPDGDLWLADNTDGTIVRITTNGQMTKFPVYANPFTLAAGPDGNLWFDGMGAPSVGRITPTGMVSYPLPALQDYGFASFTAGLDGNLWMAGNSATNAVIVRATP